MNPQITFLFNKVCRDKIPEKLIKKEFLLRTQKLSSAEMIKALKEKLLEEAREAQEASTSSELIEELADVLEVVEALCAHAGVEIGAVYKTKAQKRIEKGGFQNPVKILSVSKDKEASVGCPLVAAFRANPAYKEKPG